jgi:hypothetical protein
MIAEHTLHTKRDWDASLPYFLFVHMASIHDSASLTPDNVVFGKEPRQPCDLLFGTHPDKERTIINHTVDLVDRLHNFYNYACQHPKLASDRIKTPYDGLISCAGYYEDDDVWLSRPTARKKNHLSFNPHGTAHTG